MYPIWFGLGFFLNLTWILIWTDIFSLIWDLIWHIFSNVQFNQTYFSRLVFNLGWHFFPELGFVPTFFPWVGIWSDIFSPSWDLTWPFFPELGSHLTCFHWYSIWPDILSPEWEDWFDLYNGVDLYMCVCFLGREVGVAEAAGEGPNPDQGKHWRTQCQGEGLFMEKCFWNLSIQRHITV